ncbi:MAG: hypothetical protein WDO19_13470 [Bacteroidota bacterium]
MNAETLKLLIQKIQERDEKIKLLLIEIENIKKSKEAINIAGVLMKYQEEGVQDIELYKEQLPG